MGTKFQWGLKGGEIALLVIILILVPLRTTGSYNTFFREYDFTFPKNDVIYQNAYFGQYIPNIKKNITLPSMDIIGASVRLNDLNFLDVQMQFGGHLYTNKTTIYYSSVFYHINSTSMIKIFIKNFREGVTSVNQSLATIVVTNTAATGTNIGSLGSQLILRYYNVTPSINSDTIKWLVDLSNLNNIIPLSQIFTGISFSNQTQITYQNDIQFVFQIYNYFEGTNYHMYIHNEYYINYVGTPPSNNFTSNSSFWVILFFCLVVILTTGRVIYNNRKKR